MPYLQSLVKNEDQITLSPSPNNGVRVFSSPATGNLDMGQYNITNVGTITVGSSGTLDATITFVNTGGSFPLEANGGDLYFAGELLAVASNIQNIADWADYKASSNIDVDNQNVENVSSIVFYGESNLDVVASKLNYAGAPVSADWWSHPAAGAVDMSNNQLDNVGTINQSAGATANLQDTVILNNLTQDIGFVAELPVIQTSSIGTISGGLASELAFSNTDSVAGFQYKFNGGNIAVNTVQSLSGTRTQMLNGVDLNLAPGGTYGALTTDALGSNLFWNGSAITTGSGGNVSTWSTFPATNPVVGTGASPLTIGSNDRGTVLNATVMALNATDVLTTVDGGLLPVVTADYNVTAEGGSYGNITLNAKAGATAPVIGSLGGLITLEADSGSALIGGLSRINMNAATLTLTSGAVGAIAFVPSAINLLTTIGGGIYLATLTGPITINSGVAAQMAGGLGVFLDGGATNGVNVASNNSLYVNTVRPNGNATVAFPDSIKPSAIYDVVNSSGASGQVLTAGTGGSVVWAAASGGGGSGSVGTIFVSPSGNDTTGNGSATSPYLTIAKAITVAALIADSIPVVIQLFAGTFTENVVITRANTFINGLAAVAQECYINGSVSFTVNTSTLTFIIGGMSGVRMNRLVCAGTPTLTTEYTFINCVMISGSGVIPFDGSQGGAVTYNVVFDGCTFSPTDTRAAGVTGITCSFLRCLLSVLTQNTVVFVTGNGVVSLIDTQLSSSYAGTDALGLLTINNSIIPPASHRISQCRLFYTSATTDITGTKACIRFSNSAAVSMTIENCFFNCVGAITGGTLIQCIQKPGAGAVALTYGNIQAVSPAVWIAPTITRTILNSVQQGVNAVGGGGVPGVGAGDYLVWDGNQWVSGGTTVSLGRGAGNAGDVTCVNIGQNAGTSANTNGVAIGNGAGAGTTSAFTVAVGQNSGTTSGQGATAVGASAGVNCGIGSTSIGTAAQAAGLNCIAIGNSAGAGSSPAFQNCIVISADGSALQPAASSTCKINPIRNASLTPATFTASTAGNLGYNNTTKEVTYNNTSYRCSLLTSPGSYTLSPNLFGTTYIVTGTGTTTFVTTSLTAGDAGFFLYLKNGTNPGADITLAGVSGATTLHQGTGSMNSGVVVLLWNGTTLTAY